MLYWSAKMRIIQQYKQYWNVKNVENRNYFVTQYMNIMDLIIIVKIHHRKKGKGSESRAPYGTFDLAYFIMPYILSLLQNHLANWWNRPDFWNSSKSLNRVLTNIALYVVNQVWNPLIMTSLTGTLVVSVGMGTKLKCAMILFVVNGLYYAVGWNCKRNC